MKTNIYSRVLCLSSLALIVCACSLEKEKRITEAEKNVFTMYVKASCDGYKPSTKAFVLENNGKRLISEWAVGDSIFVYATSGKKAKIGILKTQESGTQATFSGKIKGSVKTGDRLFITNRNKVSFDKGKGTLEDVWKNQMYSCHVYVTGLQDGEIETSKAEFKSSQTICRFRFVDEGGNEVKVKKLRLETHNSIFLEQLAVQSGDGLGTVFESFYHEIIPETASSTLFMTFHVDASNKQIYTLKATTQEGKTLYSQIRAEFKEGKYYGATIKLSATLKEIPHVYITSISSVEDLKALREDVMSGYDYTGKTVTLTQDIDMQGVDFLPIGKGSFGFAGVFDGGNHTISNLTINAPKDYEKVGLFSCISRNFKKGNDDWGIKNLHLENCDIRGPRYVGAIVGSIFLDNGLDNASGLIENCTVSGSVKAYEYESAGTLSGYDGGETVGGIVGGIYGSVGCSYKIKIKGCTNNATVSGSTDLHEISSGFYTGGHIGGIVGEGRKAEIRNCTNNGDISGNVSVGGIAGSANNISSCVNNGKITASAFNPAGIVGYVADRIYTDSEISKCKNYGAVKSLMSSAEINSGNSNAGGIIGNFSHGKASENENYGTVVGYNRCGGIAGCSKNGAVSMTGNTNSAAIKGNAEVGRIVGFLGKGTLSGNFYTSQSSVTVLGGGAATEDDGATLK